MKNQLRKLLDKLYELEGLTHLALKRDDVNEDLLCLISSKGKSIADICEDIDKDEYINSSTIPIEKDKFSIDEYSIDEENEEINNDVYYTTGDNNIPLYQDIKKGKLVFTINERYRFKRELFENSDADFNNTLAVIASMEDYEEAEEYFISEEGFNMGNPVVREFMEVIKKYFK